MAIIQTQQDLHLAILHLEQQQLLDKQTLQEHYHKTFESMQPANILKNITAEINDADNLKKDILKAAVTLAVGFIAKKIIESFIIKSKTPIALAIGTALELIIANWVGKNSKLLKEIALYFFRIIINKRLQQQQVLLPVK